MINYVNLVFLTLDLPATFQENARMQVSVSKKTLLPSFIYYLGNRSGLWVKIRNRSLDGPIKFNLMILEIDFDFVPLME